jgi:hypothetical protein
MPFPTYRQQGLLSGCRAAASPSWPAWRHAVSDLPATGAADRPRPAEGPADAGLLFQQESRLLLDLRTLVPIDIEAIKASVRKTGRCVIVHEALWFVIP